VRQHEAVLPNDKRASRAPPRIADPSSVPNESLQTTRAGTSGRPQGIGLRGIGASPSSACRTVQYGVSGGLIVSFHSPESARLDFSRSFRLATVDTTDVPPADFQR